MRKATQLPASRAQGRFRRELPFHLMLLPAVILVFIYMYVPLGGLIIAFQKFVPAKGLFGDQKWVGWDNFIYLYHLPGAISALRNTIIIAFFKIILHLLIPITVSILLNEIRNPAFRRTSQTLIYLPHFLSWIIMGGILIDLLSPSGGFVNRILGLFGIEPIYFLGSNEHFRFTLIITDVWKEFGYNAVIYLAALTGISPSLYEAAAIDGAGRWKQTLHVTIPGLIPTVVLLSTLAMGNVLNAGFDQVFNMYNQLVISSADIIDTYVYRIGITNMQFSLGTAAGLFKSVVSLILVVISYSLAYKFADYSRAGLAIVSSLGGESDMLLAKYGAGASYRAHDARSLAAALRSLSPRLAEAKAASRRMAEAEFDATAIYDEYVGFVMAERSCAFSSPKTRKPTRLE